jgi:Tfp pilus assembly protein PilX
MITARGWWTLGGMLAILLLVLSTIHLAQANGRLREQVKDKDEALRAASSALSKAADNLREYQDGNVLNREEAARICRADVLAAYDAGRLRDQRTVAERAASGAFVPGQRPAGGDR